MTMHASDDRSRQPRHEIVELQRPVHVAHPEMVDLAGAIEIFNSPELSDEIWAANNYDPDFEA